MHYGQFYSRRALAACLHAQSKTLTPPPTSNDSKNNSSNSKEKHKRVATAAEPSTSSIVNIVSGHPIVISKLAKARIEVAALEYEEAHAPTALLRHRASLSSSPALRSMDQMTVARVIHDPTSQLDGQRGLFATRDMDELQYIAPYSGIVLLTDELDTLRVTRLFISLFCHFFS